jgi:SAM-dependent methyltransferase
MFFSKKMKKDSQQQLLQSNGHNHKRHLYNTPLFFKIRWSFQRFGIRHFVMKPLRTIFAPLIIRFARKSGFVFDNKTYTYFYHRYNMTWTNERTVEVPIVKDLIDSFGSNSRILEVGNVLSHYYSSSWIILDKFERHIAVINEDVCDFRPEEKFDLIVSISTLEHIGYDDDAGASEQKILLAVENLKENCLKKRGHLIITVPIGYNPHMDRIIRENKLQLTAQRFMKKTDRTRWREASKEEAIKSRYGWPFLYANAIFIGEYMK